MNISKVPTFQSSIDFKHNSFGALKTVLCLMVIVYHAFCIGGYGKSPLECYGITLGTIAVDGFFIISGFLVSHSFSRSGGIAVFFKRRLVRILPQYWACLFISAFILAPTGFLLEHHGSFKGSDAVVWQAVRYVVSNSLVFIRTQTMPSVFCANPLAGVVNGSLWMLFPLLCCYTLLPLVVRVIAKNTVVALSGFAIAVLLYGVGGRMLHVFSGGASGVVWKAWGVYRLWCCFFAGMIYYRVRALIPYHGGLFLLIAGLLVASVAGGWFVYVSFLFLPYILLMAAAQRFGCVSVDYSFGLFLYSFPLQQILFVMVQRRVGLELFVVLSVAASFMVALIHFHFLEKPLERFRLACTVV